MSFLRPASQYAAGSSVVGILGLLILGLPGGGHVAMPAGPAPVLHAVSSLATLPLRFEENLGQTDAEVRFLARGRAYTFFLTQDEAVLALRSESRRTSSDTRPRVLRMKLVGAERQAELRGEDTLASSSHYFRGNDPARWRTGVHHYKRVRRQAVYPGIDVVYYGAHGSLEYDFEVSPGADPRRIELQFHGQDSLSIDEAGDLVFQLDSQPLRYEKPLIYQSYGEERVIIAGRYEPRGAGRVGFELAADYDPSRPLIIDPVLNYSTFLGDTDDEQGNSIAVGPDGSAYIVGATQSSRFPTTTGSAQPAFGGPEDDVFVAKLNPLGTGLVFSTFLGDDENDRGRGVAVGSDGSVYVVGETESGEFPTTAGAWQPEFARGGRDGFVAKISPDGSRLVYSTFLGSDQDDWATGVAVDTQGQAHVIGGTRSSKFPTTPLSLQRQLGGGSDAFIVKIMPDGSGPVFSTFLGGGSDDEGLAIAVDLFSTIYATGYTQSNSFPVTADAFQPERDSDEDAFVVKIFGQGTVLARSSFFGGNSSDFGNAIAIDSVGAVYICGFTRSNDLPKGPTVFQNEYNGGGDAFVVKVVEAPRFQIAHMTYLGTGEEDTSNGIVVSDDGSVTVAGHTKSAGFPVTDGAVQSEFGGGDGDAFVATLDPLFRRLTFSTFLGGEGRDEARGIARGGDGSFFVTGLTRSASFPIAAGAAQPAKSDGDDVFAVKISEALTLTSVSAASYLPGGPVAPNSIASAFSHDLAPGAEQAAALPLPSELLGVQASVIDSTGFSRSAALFFVSPQQINFLVPEGTALGTATVEISRGGEVIARGTVTVEAVAPALFSINSSGEGVAAGVLIVERADGSRTTQRIFDPDQFPPNIQPIPVNIGTAADQAVLLLFGTGIRGAGGAANVSVEIGGEQQMVAYAGDQLQYAGLDQVNVPLSPSLAGRGLINIRLSAGGRVTNTVTIRVQ